MSVVSAILSVGSKVLKDGKSGVVKGITKNLGAIGKAIGKNVGSYFSGFKQGGFRCLGKQAFNKGDLDRAMETAKNQVTAVDFSNPEAVSNYLSDREYEIKFNEHVLGKLKSPCSKDNTRYYIDFLRGLINEVINVSPYEFEVGIKHSHQSGGSFTHKSYKYIGNKEVGLSVLPNPVPKVEVPKAEDTGKNDTDDLPVENLLDGIDPALYTPGLVPPEREIEELELVGKASTGTPTWNIGGGGRTKDGVDWSFGAGKQNDNTLQLLMMGMFGLLAYKVLFDRR